MTRDSTLAASKLPHFELGLSTLVEKPMIASWIAVPLFVLSIMIMAFSSLFSTVPILLFYLIWLPQLAFRGIGLLRINAATLLCLLLPAVALLSTLWSEHLPVTFRAGMQYVSMGLCALIIARCLHWLDMARGLLLGASACMLLTLLDGTYAMDVMSGDVTLVGPFGSKNVVGVISELGIASSIVLALTPGIWREKLGYVAPLTLLCAYTLIKSHSASSVLSLFICIAAILAVMVVGRMGPVARRAMLALTVIATVAIIAMFSAFDLQDIVLKSFGKDSTLTGRTELWSAGIDVARKNPVIGIGYQGFWVHNERIAEYFWHYFHIESRTGFHFHNTPIQFWVDLGVIGVVCAYLLFLMPLWYQLRILLRRGVSPELLFLLSISLIYLIRSGVEVDIYGPYGLGILLVMISLIKSHRMSRETASGPQPEAAQAELQAVDA